MLYPASKTSPDRLNGKLPPKNSRCEQPVLICPDFSGVAEQVWKKRRFSSGFVGSKSTMNLEINSQGGPAAPKAALYPVESGGGGKPNEQGEPQMTRARPLPLISRIAWSGAGFLFRGKWRNFGFCHILPVTCAPTRDFRILRAQVFHGILDKELCRAGESVFHRQALVSRNCDKP